MTKESESVCTLMIKIFVNTWGCAFRVALLSRRSSWKCGSYGHRARLKYVFNRYRCRVIDIERAIRSARR